MLKEIVGIAITVIIVLVLWLNPGILSGITDTVKEPVKAWVDNPNSIGDHMPWQIDPDKIKKAAGKKTDKDPGKTQDEGQTVKLAKDPGQAKGAGNVRPQKTRDLGETVDLYPSEKAATKANAVKKSPAKPQAKAKSQPSQPKSSYTESKLGVRAVAVQEAQGL